MQSNDLISRSELLKKSIRVTETDEGGWERVLRAVPVEEIEKAEAVDAAPVVYAEWDHWGGDEWQCTNCAEFVHTEGSWERPWQKNCPHCGAKMDEETGNAQEKED